MNLPTRILAAIRLILRLLAWLLATFAVVSAALLCPASPLTIVGWTDCGGNIDGTRIQIKKMEEALVVYASKHKGRFPARLEDAAKYFPGGEVPVDAWGNPFVYTSPSEPCAYRLVSYGADGVPGGEDADADIDSCAWEPEWEGADGAAP